MGYLKIFETLRHLDACPHPKDKTQPCNCGVTEAERDLALLRQERDYYEESVHVLLAEIQRYENMQPDKQISYVKERLESILHGAWKVRRGTESSTETNKT